MGRAQVSFADSDLLFPASNRVMKLFIAAVFLPILAGAAICRAPLGRTRRPARRMRRSRTAPFGTNTG